MSARARNNMMVAVLLSVLVGLLTLDVSHWPASDQAPQALSVKDDATPETSGETTDPTAAFAAALGEPLAADLMHRAQPAATR
jgi:hypothetical protein